jgi:hypothetical protein
MKNQILFEEAKTAQCIVNSAFGIYSGQVFAERYQEYFKNQHPDKLEDLNNCLEGPENEFYYDSFCELLNCTLEIEGKIFCLFQLEDVFMVELDEYYSINWDLVN